MADAPDLGSGARKGVGVRLPPLALARAGPPSGGYTVLVEYAADPLHWDPPDQVIVTFPLSLW